MSGLGQRTLISLLTERDAVEYLAREGLPLEAVPNEGLRGVVEFALEYFHESGRAKAPTEAVLLEHYRDLLDDEEIDLSTAEESIEWAVMDLKATYVHKQVSQFNKDLATTMAEAEVADRVKVVQVAASELVNLSIEVESRAYAVDAREGMTERLLAYEARANHPDTLQGMTFGMGQVDEYTRGIHDGELAVLAAGPKVGKSYFACKAALNEWDTRGRAVCLYTLENSPEMMLDRMACAATGVSARAWQDGRCTPEDVDLVRGWIADQQRSDVPLWVLQPPSGKRTAEAMVREAQLRGADSLLIDQLTFMEHPAPGRKPRHEVIGDIMRSLKLLISVGHDLMPCLLMHQINREGVVQAQRDGHVQMHHLAESAEVERTADWVFGLYQSENDKTEGMAKFQTLAVRRAEIENFELMWSVDIGQAVVRRSLGRTLEPAV